jgi:hypothetical protein
MGRTLRVPFMCAFHLFLTRTSALELNLAKWTLSARLKNEPKMSPNEPMGSFWAHFGLMVVSFCEPKMSPEAFLLWAHFGLMVVSFFEPKWAQNEPKMSPKRAHGLIWAHFLTKWAQMSPSFVQFCKMSPTWAQMRPNEPIHLRKNQLFTAGGLILGSFWAHVGLILGSFYKIAQNEQI